MHSFDVSIYSPDVVEYLESDFELVKTIYSDSIKVLADKDSVCKFKVNLKYAMEVEDSTREIIKDLKFDELLCDKQVMLPYSILFVLHKECLKVTVNCFWMKKQLSVLQSFETETQVSEDSGFFNIIEHFKSLVSHPNKAVLINWLQKMKEESVIRNGRVLSNSPR